MNPTETMMKHVVENGIHWPRKDLSSKGKAKSGIGKPGNWFKGARQTAGRPQRIGMKRKWH